MIRSIEKALKMSAVEATRVQQAPIYRCEEYWREGLDPHECFWQILDTGKGRAAMLCSSHQRWLLIADAEARTAGGTPDDPLL